MNARIPIVLNEFLPLTPTLEADVVRSVRHGLKDVLEWLGEDVGPKPGEVVHSIEVGGVLYVSRKVWNKLLESGK